MLRVETEFFEVVHADNRRTRYDTLVEARSAQVRGEQLRRRVDFEDVPAEYAVRDDDGTEWGRFARPQDAAVFIKAEHPGAKAHMVRVEPKE